MSRVFFDAAKRTLDLGVAAVVLILSLPLQIIVAALVLVNLGRPVIFRQPRPGREGKVFTLYKFRTMRPADPAVGTADDAARLTAFGRLLRGTSLDELPTFWNVLLGDMSLVGPRPLLVSYLDRYTPVQARRHEVRPGVTGLAQVSGRNTVDWDERLQLDVKYVDTRSMRLDLWILWRTVAVVVRRDGVSADGHATMPEFRGLKDADA
ncbi:sugar transferase [Microbacterium oxydans]|uniref:sugar transferase n=1 Tax=Microbacterium TaxID=33882 RepID=UPI00187D1296|nr:sugar transferase [Microbacterium sp. R1]MBE7953411.1 sugar transferase [Microbacterium sp. R1]